MREKVWPEIAADYGDAWEEITSHRIGKGEFLMKGFGSNESIIRCTGKFGSVLFSNRIGYGYVGNCSGYLRMLNMPLFEQKNY